MPLDIEKYLPKRSELEEAGLVPSEDSVDDYRAGIASNKRTAAILDQMIPTSQSQILLGLKPAKADFNQVADANIARTEDPAKASERYLGAIKAYQSLKESDPENKLRLEELKSRLDLSKAMQLEGMKQKNALALLKEKQKEGLVEVVDPVTGQTSVVSTKNPKLNATEKKENFQASEGEKAVQGMTDALADGDATFSLWGDNDFTRNARNAAEMYGRLQSGGAINKDEEARFMAMLPTFKDSAEQQKKKLEGAMAYFKNRQAAYGTRAPEPEQTVASKAAKPELVVVSNGKEKLKIPMSRLKEAEADGYSVVGE